MSQFQFILFTSAAILLFPCHIQDAPSDAWALRDSFYESDLNKRLAAKVNEVIDGERRSNHAPLWAWASVQIPTFTREIIITIGWQAKDGKGGYLPGDITPICKSDLIEINEFMLSHIKEIDFTGKLYIYYEIKGKNTLLSESTIKKGQVTWTSKLDLSGFEGTHHHPLPDLLHP